MAAEEFSVMRFCFALTVTTTCRVLVSRKNRMCDLIVGQGPEGRRLNVSPALPGWADVWMMIPSAVGAAPYRSATRPNFALLGRGTSLSNEINATESTNQLIWTALRFRRPRGTELGNDSNKKGLPGGGPSCRSSIWNVIG
jgi:hypothetical protein